MFDLFLTVDSNYKPHNGIQIQYNVNDYLISVLLYKIKYLVHVSSKKGFYGETKE